MKVLIRKDSSDIRNRLERLGYTASEKALDGFGDGIFVDKSDNTFHVKSEWKVIRMFLETVDCGDDENMFFDFVENDITSIMPMMLGKYKSLIKIGDFPIINTSSIQDVLYREDREHNIIEVIVISVYGLKLKSVKDVDFSDSNADTIIEYMKSLHKQLKEYIKWSVILPPWTNSTRYWITTVCLTRRLRKIISVCFMKTRKCLIIIRFV